MNDMMTLIQKADALEAKMSRELDYIVIKSRLYSMADGDMGPAPNAAAIMAKNPNARVLMGDDPRLPAMPEKPTLMDFFKYRFGPPCICCKARGTRSRAGCREKMVLACLLHDISTDRVHPRRPRLLGRAAGRALCRRRSHLGDPRAPGAALLSRRVGRLRISAILHQDVRRGLPPDPYIEEDYKRMRNHKWYMSGRMITVHDIYSFDPDVHVELEEFTDVIGRNFRQPEQGLGFDNSPVAHMWRAMIRPAKYL